MHTRNESPQRLRLSSAAFGMAMTFAGVLLGVGVARLPLSAAASAPSSVPTRVEREVVIRNVIHEVEAAPHADEAAEPESPAPVEPAVDRAAAIAEHEANLEQAFQRDGRPDMASRERESGLRAAFRVEGIKSVNAECRAKHCRAEILLDNPEIGAPAMDRILMSALPREFEGYGFTVTKREAGAATVHLYADERTE